VSVAGSVGRSGAAVRGGIVEGVHGRVRDMCPACGVSRGVGVAQVGCRCVVALSLARRVALVQAYECGRRTLSVFQQGRQAVGFEANHGFWIAQLKMRMCMDFDASRQCRGMAGDEQSQGLSKLNLGAKGHLPPLPYLTARRHVLQSNDHTKMSSENMEQDGTFARPF
jgi:hypothetical protein